MTVICLATLVSCGPLSSWAAGADASHDADSAIVMPRDAHLPFPLPQVTLLNVDAETVPLGDFRGAVLLLEFWATTCKPCVKRISELEKLLKDRRSGGFLVVGASLDSTAAIVQHFVGGRHLTYPILLDLDRVRARTALDVHVLPALFLVNRAGLVVRRWEGKINQRHVTAAVDSLLAAEPAPAR